MSTRRPRRNAIPPEPLRPVELRTWWVLGAVLALGLLLRGVRLNEAPGGFLMFNEGWYIDLGMRMAQQPILAWLLHPLDVNNPPLYAVVVSTMYKMGAEHVAAARAISVLAGICSVALTFLLGRLLFDERTGLISAGLLAIMPGAVLVDHNIQVDSLFVALLLGSVYLYARARRDGLTLPAFFGGAALGFSFLTKQPAILLLPVLAVWETWCTHDLSWLKAGRVWRFVVGFAAVGTPWYLIQAATGNLAPMFANAARISGGGAPLTQSSFWSSALLAELVWMLFPITALLAIGGLAYAGWKRETGDKLLLVMATAYLVWYLAFHFHTYYLLPLAPVLALMAGRASIAVIGPRVEPQWARTALITTLLAVMTLASVVMLGGQKWGRWSPMSYARAPDAGFSSVHLYYDPEVEAMYGPTMQLIPAALSPTAASPAVFASSPQSSTAENLYLSSAFTAADGTEIVPPGRESVSETWWRPVLFGYAIGQIVPVDERHFHFGAAQRFANAPWTATRVGPPWRIGMLATPMDSGLYLYTPASFGR